MSGNLAENQIQVSGKEDKMPINENIQVDISGAIKNPGVIKLDFNSRLADLIYEAGGFTEEASEDWIARNINLSSSLEDAQKIYIPYKWDTVSYNSNKEEKFSF